MSISTYRTSNKSTPLRTLTKKDIAQYIFDNGLTQHTTINKYSMSGKDFIKMISSNEQFYYINLDNVGERKIYLEISDKKFNGPEMINIEYQDDAITFLTPTYTMSINDDDDINIFFRDAYIDKIHLLNAQPYNRRAILYCMFKMSVRYIIIILQWILANI
uniref:Uncharacterized protein n=1 Tax=viral metagenome TaxID=1070528 RepID=A0A6C0C9K5_9ZZZZ